ncbi:ribonuclease [Amycolatopsis alkalitolerans]|uniref:Ribonuclease n=1 Tax=Amycolatopsis alkalitolerans TaxID=2547244 RepID=A0A5C4LVX0_9PSEU|nr:ribonuclease [Amycolatopsis alkalitolerans]TNC22449.1 ribonuclease [Amycolatopsis alkalitolerans]
MTNKRSRLLAGFFALLVTLFAGFGLVTPAQAAVASPVAAAQASCGDTSGFTVAALSSLPPEATDTYDLIQKGGPYPYPEDGTVFQNREGLLPDCSSGYYHEYTVETPGSSTRGARRIISGEGGEYFYTGDHYSSFELIDVSS